MKLNRSLLTLASRLLLAPVQEYHEPSNRTLLRGEDCKAPEASKVELIQRSGRIPKMSLGELTCLAEVHQHLSLLKTR